jgi:uncharacterized protein (DUF2336 family)
MMPVTEAGARGSLRSEEETLLQLARERSAEGRRLLVGVVSDLYFGKETVLTAQERSLATAILKRLIEEVAAPLCRSLAARLSGDAGAPRDLVAALANDEIEIADPILLKSPALLDMELVELIRHRSLDHQLAVAMRRALSETAADALVEGGHADAITALVENDDDAISQATLAYLVDRARSVDPLQEPVLRRQDLTPRLARKMRLWISAALRQHVLENFGIDAAALDDAIEAITRGSAADTEETDRPRIDWPMELARRLSEAGQITPQLLVATLRQGEVALFEALLCRLSGLRATLVRRLLFEREAECLAALARALGLDKPTFASIFLLTRRARPGGTPDPRDLSNVLAFFDRTDPAVARAVVTRWRRDPEYLDAIRHVSDARQTLERLLNETRSHVGSN